MTFACVLLVSRFWAFFTFVDIINLKTLEKTRSLFFAFKFYFILRLIGQQGYERFCLTPELASHWLEGDGVTDKYKVTARIRHKQQAKKLVELRIYNPRVISYG